MSFMSILFNEQTNLLRAEHAEIPPFFVDLNLDQVIDAISADWKEYNLKPFFYFKPDNIDAIRYRQEVFQDLENVTLFKHVRFFTERMREVRKHLIMKDKLHYHYQKEIWFLYAVEIYCDSIKHFVEDLSSSESLNSRGFLAFREYLNNYTASVNFTTLSEELNRIKVDLANVKYRVIIKSNSFTVQNYETEIDYSAEIEETFEKFKQGAVKNYLVKYKSSPEDMNHIEYQILDFVAQLNPELFSRLDNIIIRNVNFIDETIAAFDREIHFYISYLEHIEKFKLNKLQFCYPNVVSESKEIFDYEGFDLALAQKLFEENAQIVCNDFFLKGKERIIVVTGPNQGGKTTFARTFGQLHFLANIGCPVPGREAQLFLFDKIFTQFERVEKVENLRGKLEDDLKRILSILEQATPQSVIIMNEIFNSTTLQDMTLLSKKVLEKIVELDLLCAWVTFIDELASFNEKTVSMTSMVDPIDPALRTYKVIRRSADGLAYAMAIAEKYRLTYNHIKERIEL